MDDLYADPLDSGQRGGTLPGIFERLAIFISYLSLFGLSSNLWYLLSKEFVVLVIIPWLLAIPVSAYYMYDWLKKFPYRITLSWTTFILAALGVMTLTLVTVSYQAIRASPVKSLRCAGAPEHCKLFRPFRDYTRYRYLPQAFAIAPARAIVSRPFRAD